VVPSCRCQNEKVPENPLDLSVGCVWSNGRAYYAPWAAIWGAVGARWIVMALKAADQKSESFAKDVLSEKVRCRDRVGCCCEQPLLHGQGNTKGMVARGCAKFGVSVPSSGIVHFIT